MTSNWEVLAGGPWLAWVTWDEHGRPVEEVTIDTMTVTSLHSRYDGVTRIITPTSVILVYEGVGAVTQWVIAARRGVVDPSLIFGEAPEGEEVLGD